MRLTQVFANLLNNAAKYTESRRAYQPHGTTESLQTLLESLGAVVVAAGSGHEALGVFESFWPDAVLLDIGMPGMDGYEVARRIRALPSGHRTQIIALTGWGQQEDIRRCMQAGFDHHMVKPQALGLRYSGFPNTCTKYGCPRLSTA